MECDKKIISLAIALHSPISLSKWIDIVYFLYNFLRSSLQNWLQWRYFLKGTICLECTLKCNSTQPLQQKKNLLMMDKYCTNSQGRWRRHSKPVDCLTESQILTVDELFDRRQNTVCPCLHDFPFLWLRAYQDLLQLPQGLRYVLQWRNIWCSQ